MMNRQRDSVIYYLLRRELSMRSVVAKENTSFRIGRKNIKLDFYIPKESTGIIVIDWKRNVHTNKLLQLEDIINAIKLKRLVLICNGLSGNAKDFLKQRNIPIDVLYLSEIIKNQNSLNNIFSGS